MKKNIPLSLPIIGQEEKQAVLAVLDSGFLVQGSKVAELEREFTKLCSTNYAVATSSGTAALHIALYSIGIRPGDEVITTPFTFVATANSILMVGAESVFVDIDEQTFNIDYRKIEKAITKKTRAILAVNLYGQSADYEEIEKIARKYNLLIIEDAAQSINATYKGKKSGNLADISCFSLYATKNIMCGEGGMITTNKKEYHEKAKRFRHHGQSETKKYHYSGLGYNYRLTDIQATIALVQLKRVDKITKKRQEIAQKYNKALRNIKGLMVPYVTKDRTHVYHQYTIKVANDFILKRDELRTELGKKGIQTNIYYPKPLYRFGHLKGKSIDIKQFPVTEKIVNEVLSIPVRPNLIESEVNFIIKTIKSYAN